MAVSTLVEVLGGEFLKYMEAFKPFLGIGLKIMLSTRFVWQLWA